MQKKKELTNRKDVELFVHKFYDKIRKDSLLEPIFSKRITKDTWAEHLHTMCDFWESILFFKAKYKGFPFPKHIGLDIGNVHFDKWIELFTQTIETYFVGQKSNEAILRAKKIREVFQSKLEKIK